MHGKYGEYDMGPFTLTFSIPKTVKVDTVFPNVIVWTNLHTYQQTDSVTLLCSVQCTPLGNRPFVNRGNHTSLLVC